MSAPLYQPNNNNVAQALRIKEVSECLPKFPYDGQVFVDGNSVKWQWSAPLDVWVRIGTANTIPLATSTTPGLLSPQL